MTFPLLQSSFFVSRLHPALVPHPRLVEQLNDECILVGYEGSVMRTAAGKAPQVAGKNHTRFSKGAGRPKEKRPPVRRASGLAELEKPLEKVGIITPP